MKHFLVFSLSLVFSLVIRFPQSDSTPGKSRSDDVKSTRRALGGSEAPNVYKLCFPRILRSRAAAVPRPEAASQRAVNMIKTERILHLKSSRGGKVRVVREHYLRERVPCYSSLCRHSCDNGTDTRDTALHVTRVPYT